MWVFLALEREFIELTGIGGDYSRKSSTHIVIVDHIQPVVVASGVTLVTSYVPLVSMANYRPSISHFWVNVIFAIPTLSHFLFIQVILK